MVQSQKALRIGLLIGLLVLFILPLSDISVNPNNTQSSMFRTDVSAEVVMHSPTVYATPVYDQKTLSFVNKTRNIAGNTAVSIEQIYYRVGTLKILDPTLISLSPSDISFLTSQVLSFQRTSGGFGNWEDDRSSISPTHMALQVLDWLGYSGLNETAVENYLDRLQNSLTDGFNSHLLDADSDVHSTYHAISSYQLIGSTPNNSTAVIAYLRRAQNPDGGFGLQTNSEKGIFWTSRATVSQDAILGLGVYGVNATDPSAALDFLRGLQLVSSGGFVNQVDIISTSASYTAAALEAIDFLGGVPENISSVSDYLYSLEGIDGGFRLSPSSTESSLMGTYYAVHALSILGESPSSISATIEYMSNPPTSDGFGGTPGDSPTLRETFDAVSTYILMGEYPVNAQGIIDYVASYRNPDGGFGLTGSYAESTLRALETYDLLGVSYPNSSETITFLQNLQQPNGGFAKSSNDTVPYVVSTYRALRSLEILGSQPLNTNGAITYLQGLQNGDGGWGGFIGDSSDATSSYRAIRGLSILNSQPQNPSLAVTFLQSSQNLDGGFRRSQLDTVRPNNISNTIFTYSAVRALYLLDSYPLDMMSLFNFINSIRNLDGGYAEHPDFTSDVAYTFVSMHLLRYFHIYSDFTASYDDEIGFERTRYDTVTFTVTSRLGNIEYNITDTATTSVIISGVLDPAGEINLDISGLTNGTYILNVNLSDPTGAEIDFDVSVLIARGPLPPIVIPEDLLLYLALGAAVIVSIVALALRKRK
ncbi:MAG: prenyltransferase/squalene oxidase repeat-containing protein [Candidatus Thorarchaeota archaeon]